MSNVNGPTDMPNVSHLSENPEFDVHIGIRTTTGQLPPAPPKERSTFEKVSAWASSVTSLIPGTEASYRKQKEALKADLLGDLQATATEGAKERWSPGNNAINQQFKEETQKLSEKGVLAKIAMEVLTKNGKKDHIQINHDEIDKIQEALDKANLGKVTASQKNGELFLTFKEDGTTLSFQNYEKRGRVLTFNVVVKEAEHLSAFRLNYHLDGVTWPEKEQALKFKAQKSFEAALFKLCTSHIESPEAVENNLTKNIKEFVFSGNLDRLDSFLSEKVPLNQADLNNLINTIQNLKKKYDKCIKEATLEKVADFYAELEVACFSKPDEENLETYLNETYLKIDNRKPPILINITDIEQKNGDTVTYINTRKPLAEKSLPTTVQNDFGLANYASTITARYTPDKGVVIESHFVTHSRPVPIKEKDDGLRMAKAHLNVMQAIEDQVKRAVKSGEVDTRKTLFVHLDVTTLFSPGRFTGMFRGYENEHKMLKETLMAYESVNNKELVVTIGGQEYRVKPQANLLNFGINTLGRYEVGVDDAVNARGMFHQHARVEKFLEQQGEELLKNKGFAKELLESLASDEVREEEKELHNLEELVYQEKIQKKQKDLEIAYKLRLLVEDQVSFSQALTQAIDYDEGYRKFNETKFPITSSKYPISLSYEEFFKSVGGEKMLTWAVYEDWTPSAFNNWIAECEKEIQAEMEKLQTLCVYTDKLRRKEFDKNLKKIEAELKKAKELIDNEIRGLDPSKDQEKIIRLENLRHTLDEYISFQKAAYMRGSGAGFAGMKLLRIKAKDTVLEPAALMVSLNERIGGVPSFFCKSGKDRTGFLLNYVAARRAYTQEYGEPPKVVSVSDMEGRDEKANRLKDLLHTFMSFGTPRMSAGMNTSSPELQIGGLSLPKPLDKLKEQSDEIAKWGKKFRSKAKSRIQKLRKWKEEFIKQKGYIEGDDDSSILGDDDFEH